MFLGPQRRTRGLKNTYHSILTLRFDTWSFTSPGREFGPTLCRFPSPLEGLPFPFLGTLPCRVYVFVPARQVEDLTCKILCGRSPIRPFWVVGLLHRWGYRTSLRDRTDRENSYVEGSLHFVRGSPFPVWRGVDRSELDNWDTNFYEVNSTGVEGRTVVSVETSRRANYPRRVRVRRKGQEDWHLIPDHKFFPISVH